MAGEGVLVVDDVPANCELLSAVLGARGYDVRRAGSGAELMTVLQSFHPRIILMDIGLPDTDGLALTRQLRASPATRDIVIVAVTAAAMEDDAKRVKAAGCDGYITKPISTRTLAAEISAYLKQPQP